MTRPLQHTPVGWTVPVACVHAAHPGVAGQHRSFTGTLRRMKCPIDDSPLSVSSREGVEIDFCPQCRGVWLDRGELDKIIDRAATAYSAAPPYSAPDDRRRDDDRDEPRRDDRGDDRDRKRRKRRGFLDDLFDFD
jgi:Zn-finger nucleic acid-binding protein